MNPTAIALTFATSLTVGLAMVQQVADTDSQLWATISGGVGQALVSAGIAPASAMPDLSNFQTMLDQGNAVLVANGQPPLVVNKFLTNP